MYIFDLNTRYQKIRIVFTIIKKLLVKNLGFIIKPSIVNIFSVYTTLILLTALIPSSSSFAQLVSIDVKNESLRTILTQIKKQTNYDFVMSSKATAHTLIVSMNVQKSELVEVLEELCNSNGLSFSIKDRTIYISELKPIKSTGNTINLKRVEQDSTVKGQVLSEKGESLTGTSLRIMDKKEDIIYSNIVSDTEGNFEIPKKYMGNKLIISFMGYAPISILLKEIIGEVHLQFIPVDVQEVLIEGYKPLIERSIDKLTLNIEGTLYEKGENGLTLLSAIPGINVIGEKIQFRGSEKVTIYIDNKKLILPQHIVNTYLQGIPSEAILSYELKSVPGAENDAQNSGSIINIVMKSEY